MLGDTQYTKCFCSFLVQFSSSVSSRHPPHRSRRGPRAARPRAAPGRDRPPAPRTARRAPGAGPRPRTAARSKPDTRGSQHDNRTPHDTVVVAPVQRCSCVPWCYAQRCRSLHWIWNSYVWGRELRTPTRAGRGTGHLQSCSACTIASPTSGCTSRPSPDPALPPDATQGTCATCNPHPEQKSTWAEGQEGQAQLLATRMNDCTCLPMLRECARNPWLPQSNRRVTAVYVQRGRLPKELYARKQASRRWER